MSPWQLEFVLNVHRNLPLKFHQNRVSNSWDIADIEFVWWGMRSHFRVKPNRCVGVEVRLGFWQLKCGPTQTFLLLAHTALVMRTTVMTTRPLILAPCAVVMCVFHNNHDCTCYKSSAGEVFVAGPFLMGALSVTGVQGEIAICDGHSFTWLYGRETQ